MSRIIEWASVLMNLFTEKSFFVIEKPFSTFNFSINGKYERIQIQPTSIDNSMEAKIVDNQF